MKAVKQEVWRGSQLGKDMKSFVKKPQVPKIGWMSKNRFSILDMLIIVVLILLIRFLAEHLHVHINWS